MAAEKVLSMQAGELRKLTSVLATAAGGQGQIVMVKGAVATGKTQLLGAFAERVHELQGVMLVADGSRAECTLPLALISQIVLAGQLPDDAADRLLASAAAHLDGRGVEGDVGAGSARIGIEVARVAHELCSTLIEMSKVRLVVVAVDDAHLADSQSMHVLLYLMRRIRQASIMIVFTEPIEPYLGGHRLHVEVARHRVHEIRLSPLSEADVAELAFDLLGCARPGLVGSVMKLSGGNPLLVEALLDEERDRAAADEPSADSRPSYLDAALDVVHRFEEWVVDVARAVAVLGTASSPELIDRIVGLGTVSCARAVQVLDDAGLILDHRFRVAAVGTALLQTTPAPVRSRLRRDAAEVMYRAGRPAPEVAELLLAADTAADTPPDQWALDVLREAASIAVANSDTETAHRCLDLALRVCATPHERLSITVALGRLQWTRNPAAAALRLDSMTGPLLAGDLSSQDAATVGRHLIWRGDAAGAATALEQIERAADRQGAAEVRLAYRAAFGMRRAGAEEPAGEARPRVGDAVPAAAVPAVAADLAREVTSPLARATGALATAVYRGGREEVLTSANHLLASLQLNLSSIEVAAAALYSLVYNDKLDMAVARCEPLIEEATRCGATSWVAVLGSVRAEIALRQGDLAMSEARARAALATMPAHGWGIYVGSPLGIMIAANTAMGRHDVAASVARQIVPRAMFETVAGARYLFARGQLQLADGRVLAALGDLPACGRVLRDLDMDRPAIMPWRSELAQVYLRVGKVRTARNLVTEQLERHGDIGSRTRGMSLRVLADCGDLRQRPALLRESIVLLQSAGDRFALATALCRLSQAHHELGEFSRARILAHRAGREAMSCHADGVAADAALIEGEGYVEVAEQCRPVGPQVLSDAERRVATLAALCHTNREIGQQLFITPSTVEQHLTRVYRKLNVHGRRDLPAGLPMILQRSGVTGDELLVAKAD